MSEKKINIAEIIQDINFRLNHLEDINFDNRKIMTKLVKQGNTIVEFLKRIDIEEMEHLEELDISLPTLTEENKENIQSLRELVQDFMEKQSDLKEFEEELKKHKDQLTPGTIGES